MTEEQTCVAIKEGIDSNNQHTQLVRKRVTTALPSATAYTPRSHTTYKIARSRDELEAALRLVYQTYLRSGLININPYQMRITPFHSLPTTEVFIATNSNGILCTLSVIYDGQLGLPMEEVYPKQVAVRRKKGIRFAEISCLADKRNGLQGSFSVIFRLMALASQCAKHREMDQLLAVIHPRHANFYRQILGFEVIGEERPYPTVCNHPAVAIALDLNTLKRNRPRVYKRLFGAPFDEKLFQRHSISLELQQNLRKAAETCM